MARRPWADMAPSCPEPPIQAAFPIGLMGGDRPQSGHPDAVGPGRHRGRVGLARLRFFRAIRLGPASQGAPWWAHRRIVRGHPVSLGGERPLGAGGRR